MLRSPEKQARAEAILGELAELGLMAAREIAVQLRESEDAQATATLAGALQKISRGVRLTIALDFKLDRDAAREAREAQNALAQAEAQAAEQRQTEAAGAPPHPVAVRKTRVGSLLNRLVWNECEGDYQEYEILRDDLRARLEEAALSCGFETTPIETLARRVMADMGLCGDFALSLGEAPPSEAAARQPQPADTG